MYRQPAIEFLSAFVRSASRGSKPQNLLEAARPLKVRHPEIQAAMDALRRLTRTKAPEAPLDLTGADLFHADLATRGPDDGINLVGARLEGAYLQRADLTGANLSGAELTGAFLQGAHLRDANLKDVRCTDATADSSTQWQQGFDQAACGVLIPQVQITSPAHKASVSQKVTVNGNAKQLPRDGSVWVLVKPGDVDRYYPQTPCKVDQDRWTCDKVGLGQPKDKGSFEIRAVIADRDAGPTLQNYLTVCATTKKCPGIEQQGLPPGLLHQQSVTVNR